MRAAEVFLRLFGIRHRPKPRAEGGDECDEAQEGFWEVDPWHLMFSLAGASVAMWMLSKAKPGHKSAVSVASICAAGAAVEASSTVMQPAAPPTRVPLSTLLHLLHTGAVVGVKYIADRPPEGALIADLAPAAVAGIQRGGLKGSSSLNLPSHQQHVEALLLPGTHSRVFEKIMDHSIPCECMDVTDSVAESINRVASMMDTALLLGCLAALGIAGITYGLSFFSGQGFGGFVGKRMEDGGLPADLDHRSSVTFDDVAGMERTKEELKEVIAYLRNPGSFYALGALPPRGILLAGPSGTGKTLLARAVAGEAKVPFLYASSAAFVEIYVGQGAQRVRQFFENARASAPAIVFLDELDAVGTSRQVVAGGNQEYAQTLNQLLLELDGMETHSSEADRPIVVTMAATNRYDCLDEALVRPGRLDRIVMVSLPNEAERLATLRIHASRLRTQDLDLETLAERTQGRSGAELAHILNEAALLAARQKADAVRQEHVEQVFRNPRPQQRSTSNNVPWSWPASCGSGQGSAEPGLDASSDGIGPTEGTPADLNLIPAEQLGLQLLGMMLPQLQAAMCTTPRCA